MQSQTTDSARRRLSETRSWGWHCGWCLALLLLVSAGCSHGKKAREAAFLAIAAPQFPEFLTAPLNVLLTNAGGFTAQVVVETHSLASTERPLSGELLARGPKLLFAPGRESSAPKKSPVGGLTFVWDVAESRGYIFSEALQGYTPIEFNVHVTNMVAGLETSALEKFNGHSCAAQNVTLQTSDGLAAGFHLLRAMDLKGFPVQIRSTTNTSPVKVSFSKIKIEVPPPDLFAPPDSFTKYDSPQAMVDELAIRHRNLKRASSGEPIQLETPETPQRRQ